ncbi:hypothetical protein [Mycobacterium sp. 1164985.4]|uniref:hypothetical protein n=1 Tax=Mycobacterium sp. 1164985.4 TaxID=1834069 RepID=UPI000A523BE8|nr:hypothetical protein [Mycobacterium sp. 1164985.4]
MTEAEENAFDDGDEPCQHVLRLYDDAAMKAAVEEYHSASVASAHNWRLTSRDE